MDGHICWNTNRRLIFIVFRPREINFRFPFPFALINGSLPLPFSVCCKLKKIAVFRYQNSDNREIWTWKHGDVDMRHGNMKRWRHGDKDMETWKHEHGDMSMETWTLRQNQTINGSPDHFPLSVYYLLIVQTEVCHLSICWRRNKRKFSVCKRTKVAKRT